MLQHYTKQIINVDPLKQKNNEVSVHMHLILMEQLYMRTCNFIKQKL